MQKIINNTTKDILKRKTKESEERNMQELKSIKRENSKKEKAKLKAHSGITLIALVITILFSYDEMIKFSNSKGFLLATI